MARGRIMTDIAEIEVTAVPAVLAAGGVLLDVREPEEWEAGHAPGARHVPLGVLPDRMGELERAGPIVVVCRSGHRSGLATEWLSVFHAITPLPSEMGMATTESSE